MRTMKANADGRPRPHSLVEGLPRGIDSLSILLLLPTTMLD